MFVSVFDIFKIGVGPSSSHTMGPMLAAHRFVERLELERRSSFPHKSLIQCTLFGSLAFTGEGHGTFRAVRAGLSGVLPERYDAEQVGELLAKLDEERSIRLRSGAVLGFDPVEGIVADRKTRAPLHPNALRFEVFAAGETEPRLSETYYSVGGGFVLSEGEFAERDRVVEAEAEVPHPFANAAEMLAMGDASGLSIAQMKR